MTTVYLNQQAYYTTGAPVYTYSPTPSNYPAYAKPALQHPMVIPAQQDPYASPQLNPGYRYVINGPCGMVPSSNSSAPSTASDCSSTIPHVMTSNSSPQFAPTPPPTHLVSPTAQIYSHVMPNVVCSPSPVVSYDPAALQSAWTIPSQNMQWQSIWVPAPMPQPQYPIHQQGYYECPQPSRENSFFRAKRSKENHNDASRKNNRHRCKACSTNSSRNGVKDFPMEDIIEATRERPELVAQLPEFFGEPLLNFQEFAHYAPILRTKALDETLYFKIPRTTKERDLNIPRRLNELYIRTFGPEHAPESKAIDRVSPHDRMCEVRMAIRTAIVKGLQETIFVGVRTMDEGNDIFNLIFRFTGVSMPKTFCNNIPQIFSSVVPLKKGAVSEDNENHGDDEAYEYLGVVSLFNYHLFRCKIKQSVV